MALSEPPIHPNSSGLKGGTFKFFTSISLLGLLLVIAFLVIECLDAVITLLTPRALESSSSVPNAKEYSLSFSRSEAVCCLHAVSPELSINVRTLSQVTGDLMRSEQCCNITMCNSLTYFSESSFDLAYLKGMRFCSIEETPVLPTAHLPKWSLSPHGAFLISARVGGKLLSQ